MRLTGPGIAPIEHAVDSLAKGENTLSLTPEWRGVGTLSFENAGSATLTVTDAAGPVAVEDPAAVVVTSGAVELTLAGDLGTVTDTVEVPPDEVVVVDLAALEPGQVSLIELPAGSTVTLVQDEKTLSVDVPWDPSTLNEETGVPLAPTTPVQGLTTGPWNYTVAHPLLGDVKGEFFAIGGEVGAATIPWREAPELASLQAKYAAHSLALEQSRPQRGPVLAAGGITLGVAGLAAGGLAYGAIQYGELRRLRLLYDTQVANGDTTNAAATYALMPTASRRTILGFGVGGVGLAATGVMLKVTLKRRSETTAASDDVQPWNPQALVP